MNDKHLYKDDVTLINVLLSTLIRCVVAMVKTGERIPTNDLDSYLQAAWSLHSIAVRLICSSDKHRHPRFFLKFISDLQFPDKDVRLSLARVIELFSEGDQRVDLLACVKSTLHNELEKDMPFTLIDIPIDDSRILPLMLKKSERENQLLVNQMLGQAEDDSSLSHLVLDMAYTGMLLLWVRNKHKLTDALCDLIDCYQRMYKQALHLAVMRLGQCKKSVAPKEAFPAFSFFAHQHPAVPESVFSCPRPVH